MKRLMEYLREHWKSGLAYLLTALITALATYWGTKRIEDYRRFIIDQQVSYEVFFDATAAYWDAGRKKEQADQERKNGNEAKAKELELEAEKLFATSNNLYAKARFKIAVFGDAEVVRSMANYWRKHFAKPVCLNNQKMLDDVAIYQNIRQALNPQGNVSRDDMILILFDCQFQ